MTGWSFYNLSLIFLLCFSCFLAGWLTAVYVLPGNLSQRNLQELKMGFQTGNQADTFLPSNENNLSTEELEKKTTDIGKVKKELPFFEEMKNNILLLLDPYKIDSVVKKNTHLEQKDNFYIKDKTRTQIPLKIQQPLSTVPKDQNNKNPSQDFNKQEGLSDPLLQESAPTESPSKIKEQKEIETLQKLQAKYDEKNREQLFQILEDQKFFIMEGKFSFLANVFSDQEKALNYVKDMKEKYPLWSFLIKAHKDHTRIYLGPFESKEKALEFKKMIPSPSPFSMDFLEEVSL